MFIIDQGKNAAGKVEQIKDYMSDHGIAISSVHLGDTSPFFVLQGGTGVGYRSKSMQGKRGIVFYCAKDGIDKENLVNKLEFEVYSNADKARPFTLFIPQLQFEEAVSILLENPNNR